jgi:2-polyprenyl-3-methyl-5-hydroxy-6-metoxy-1,4-benzoquinol methylase
MRDFYPVDYGPYQGFGSSGLSLFDARDSFFARVKNDLKYSVLSQHYACRLQESPPLLESTHHLPQRIRSGVEKLAVRFYRKRNPRVPVCTGVCKALDVGCGNGHYLLFLKRLGWNVTGFDISNRVDPSVTDAGIPVLTGSLESLRPYRGAFDVVSMWHVLEHLYDPVADLQRIRSLLSNTGTVMIEVPNSQSIGAKLLRRHWHQWDLPRHLNHFTPQSLVRLVGQAGFQVKKLTHLHKTALPQSLRLWSDKKGSENFLAPFFKLKSFNQLLQMIESPLALAPTGENLLVVAGK